MTQKDNINCGGIRPKSRRRALILLLCLLCLTIGSQLVEARLAPSTQHASITFKKYNIFVDTSKQGTQKALLIQSQRADSSSAATAPSLEDERDFYSMQSNYVYFNGKAGLRATSKQMSSVQKPVLSIRWGSNYLLS